MVASGAIVEVALSLEKATAEAFKKEETPIPEPIRVLAMIDTGATGTVIQKGLAQQLGLKPIGQVTINTPSSANVECPRYLIQLTLPNRVGGPATVIEAPLQNQHVKCLIGRDVLAHSVFVYIGYKNQFTLSF